MTTQQQMRQKQQFIGQQQFSECPLKSDNDHQDRVCSSCFTLINDKFMFQVENNYWHENCLKCDCCKLNLAELSSVAYTKGGLIVCKNCYLRVFGSNGFCSGCRMQIHPLDFVMKVKANVYHLDCFHCCDCQREFFVGDTFRLINSNQIICDEDYQRRKEIFSFYEHFNYQ